MIDERLQELASLHVLDLLDPAERAAFEAELARDAGLRALVAELRESAAAFALTAPQVSPPSALKARVLAKIAASPSPISPLPSSIFRFIPWAIAAALALACGGLGQLYLATRAEKNLLADQQQLADLSLRSIRQQLEAERILNRHQLANTTAELSARDRQLADTTAQLSARDRQLALLNQHVDTLVRASAEADRASESLRNQLADADTRIAGLRARLKAQGDLAQFKIATLASLAGNSPQALAVAVWNPSTQEGVLRVEKLPALASDKDYQLWVIDPAYPFPVDGGVFTVDPATGDARINFRPNKPVTNATKFAVSLERKGGVPKAEGPILLLGD